MGLGSRSCSVLVLVSSWAVSVVWWAYLAGVLTWRVLHLRVSFLTHGGRARLSMTWSCRGFALVLANGLGSCGWPSTLRSER